MVLVWQSNKARIGDFFLRSDPITGVPEGYKDGGI